jgi:hypothetical protein
MTAVPHLVAVRCNWCSKERHAFRVHRMASGQMICDDCLDWHQHAIAFLGGAVPRGCQECGATWEKLRDADPLAVGVKMYVVPKDGIYQILCALCVAKYLPKRADIYQGTQFGSEVLKI